MSPKGKALIDHNLIDILRFVEGSVSKKKFVPELTHFCIEEGTIRGFNGSLALSSPIPLNINCKPEAAAFVKAIKKCQETVTMTMTPANRLSIKSGPFKALINCIEGETPHVTPTGERFDFNGELLMKALVTLAPFVGDDAANAWSTGVLFSGQSAFATNNVILLEYWLGIHFPITCNIPRKTIKEMLRIKTPPSYGLMDDKSISFMYEDGRWIRSSLLEGNWPDASRMLNVESNVQVIRQDLFEAAESLNGLTDEYGRLYIRDNRIGTSLDEEEGASYELPDLNFEGVYRDSMLALLRTVATHADFTLYPKPSTFFGENIRGIIIGLKTS